MNVNPVSQALADATDSRSNFISESRAVFAVACAINRVAQALNPEPPTVRHESRARLLKAAEAFLEAPGNIPLATELYDVIYAIRHE